ncbi:MAG TPA: hypothetical protein VMU34_04165, partial [Mycobacterium sp.]|nr:hypothetical protein [Mycobacterium sp.]
MADEPQTDSTPDATVPGLTPGTLPWRITVATLAYRFFGLIHDPGIAQLIDRPAEAGQANAWSVALFNLYLQKSGIPMGESTAVNRILAAM